MLDCDAGDDSTKPDKKASSKSTASRGNSMSDLSAVANATLFHDENKDLLARMLEQALEQPLVPMEPAAAKQYMEQVAQRTASDNSTELTLFQMVQMSSSESTYVMRVALFENQQAMGLDIMDAENGQFFIPEACPVCQLAAPTLN
jgi:DNA mismatch repair ATPase MutS